MRLIHLFFLPLLACGETTGPSGEMTDPDQGVDATTDRSVRCPVDNDNYVVFDDTAHYHWGELKGAEPTALTHHIIEEAECLLHEADGIDEVDISSAIRQYQSGTINGQHFLYVNASCGTMDERFRSDWYLVQDGGPCYWQALINLTTRKVEWLTVNGWA
jgi:hypothetical protein